MKIQLFNLKITNLKLDQLPEELLSHSKMQMIVTLNPEILRLCFKDSNYANMIENSEYIICDGIGMKKIIFKKTGYDVDKIPGIELIQKLLDNNLRVFLYGSSQENLELAKINLEKKYNSTIVGYHDGYSNNSGLVEKINSSNADLLLVCLGAPLQEKFIFENKEKLNVRLAIGAGGSIDVFSGNIKRAPEFYIKHNIEWLYRNIKEPKRIKKLIKTLLFYIKIMYFNIKK